MHNAEETLQKAGKDGYEFLDKKYVQTASGTAYNGVLLALDTFLEKKEGNKYTKPASFEDYKKRLAKVNKKVLSTLNDIYSELHISGYYYGVISVKRLRAAFNDSYKIIEYIKE
ncbi:MAG: hypothetical protein EAZ27_09815 [Cytophagales bacterium]|nr:MAG: hypothetical protein EAZ27_09815 [Cytophagales bacterium]